MVPVLPGICGHTLSHHGIVFRVIFLHHAIAIGAAEVEDLVEIFFEDRKAIVHRSGNIFGDGLNVIPAPSPILFNSSTAEVFKI